MSSIIEINAVESIGLRYCPHFPIKVTIVGSFMSIHPDLISMRILTKGISLYLIFCHLLFLYNIYLKPFHASVVYIPNHLSILNSFYKWILHSLTVSVSLILFFSVITNLVKWVSLQLCAFGGALGLFLILFYYWHAVLKRLVPLPLCVRGHISVGQISRSKSWVKG